jgi:hypothetical protein
MRVHHPNDRGINQFRRGGEWTLVLAIWLGILLWPDVSQAVVQVLPDARMTVEGRDVRGPKAIAAHPVMKRLLAAFDRAETAVKHKDPEALMDFYGPLYNYHGLKQADVRRIWGEVFEHYRDLSSTHLFSEIKVSGSGNSLRAEVTCTGGLYGTEIKTGKRITLDSWFREVHYLVNEDGRWRFLGNAGEVPADAPFSSAPHHPLF